MIAFSFNACTGTVTGRSEIYRIFFGGQDVLEAVIISGLLNQGALQGVYDAAPAAGATRSVRSEPSSTDLGISLITFSTNSLFFNVS